MNRNQAQGNPSQPAPFTLAGNRFSRPWLPTRNPLQQAMPGASQMSTGGSYGTAARARGGLPLNRPAAGPSSQQAPALGLQHPPFPFTAPWSQTQPSQPEYDQHHGFQNASGADASQPAGYGGGGGFAEPLAHSQPSHTAARLLEELQGRSAPAPVSLPAKKEDPFPLLKEILEKLEAFTKNQENLQKSVNALELQLQSQASSLEPAVGIMHQASAFIKDAAAKQQKILSNLAVQTSPSQRKLSSPSRAANPSPARQHLKPQVVPAQRMRAPAAEKNTQLFSALAAEPAVGSKRPRQFTPQEVEQDEEEEEDDESEDEVTSRLAKRVQRHRKMMAKSKAVAPER